LVNAACGDGSNRVPPQDRNVLYPILYWMFGPHLALPSFPTRRSSDLALRLGLQHEVVGLLRLDDALAQSQNGGREEDRNDGFSQDRKSTRLNSVTIRSRMPSSA